MHIIHETPTYVLEADIRHDETQDIHTLDLDHLTMAKPYRRRVAQFNLPRAALLRRRKPSRRTRMDRRSSLKALAAIGVSGSSARSVATASERTIE